MSEHRVIAATTVPARIERVWARVCDFAHYADWVESTIEVLSSDVEVALGRGYEERTRLSGLWTATTRWTVTAIEPRRHLALAADGVRAVTDLTLELALEPAGDNTEITSTYVYRTRLGPLGALLELVVRGNVVNDQRRSLRTLSFLAGRDEGSLEP